MDEKQARKILEDEIESNGELYSLGRYIAWSINDAKATLDGSFTANDLEAIAWWMKNNKK